MAITVKNTNNKLHFTRKNPSTLAEEILMTLDASVEPPILRLVAAGVTIKDQSGDALVSSATLTTAITLTPVTLTPSNADGAGINMVPATATVVIVGANVNDTDDWITLPAIASVPVGTVITLISNAAGHEVRTPAASNTKINNQDSDGTKEYAIAAGGQIHRFTKISDSTGWMGQGFTAIGAVVTAVVPD